MITPEMKKDIDTAVEIIIRNCRHRYSSPLCRAMAYQMLDGLLIGLKAVSYIDREHPPYEFPSLKLEEEYQKKIDEECG